MAKKILTYCLDIILPSVRWLIDNTIWALRAIAWDMISGTWEFIKLLVLAGPRLFLFLLRIVFIIYEWTRVFLIPEIRYGIRVTIWVIRTSTADDWRALVGDLVDTAAEVFPNITNFLKSNLIPVRLRIIREIRRLKYYPIISFPYLFVPLITDKSKPVLERVVFFVSQLRFRWSEDFGAFIRLVIWFPLVVFMSCAVLTDHMFIILMSLVEHIMMYPCAQEYFAIRKRVMVSSMFYPYFRITGVIGALYIVLYILHWSVSFALEWILNRQLLGFTSKYSYEVRLNEWVFIPLFWWTDRLKFELVHSFTWISHAVWYVGAMCYLWFVFCFKSVYRSMFPLTWWYYSTWRPIWIRRQQDWIERLHNDYFSLKWWIGPDYEIVYKILMYWGRAIDYYILVHVKYYIVGPLVFAILYIPRLILSYINSVLNFFTSLFAPDAPWTDMLPELIISNYDLFYTTLAVPTVVIFKFYLRTIWFAPLYIKIEAVGIIFQIHGWYWYWNIISPILRPFLCRYTGRLVPDDNVFAFLPWVIDS